MSPRDEYTNWLDSHVQNLKRYLEIYKFENGLSETYAFQFESINDVPDEESFKKLAPLFIEMDSIQIQDNAKTINSKFKFSVLDQLNKRGITYAHDFIEELKTVHQSYSEEHPLMSFSFKTQKIKYMHDQGIVFNEMIDFFYESLHQSEDETYHKLSLSNIAVLLSDLGIIDLLENQGISGKKLHSLLSHIVSDDHDKYAKNMAGFKTALRNPLNTYPDRPRTEKAYTNIRKVLNEIGIENNFLKDKP